jgi:S1-C subfamily serine protease
MKVPRLNPFLLLLLLGIGGWLLFGDTSSLVVNRRVEVRAVTPRGDLAADEQNTIDIFRNAAPSVVYIDSIALRRGFFSLNAVEIPQGTGSGFVWDTYGRVVTNYHVISNANRIQVGMADQSVHKAVLIGADPDKDIAVLQVDAPAHLLRPIAIGESGPLLVGQKVFAIGNPFGLDQTITSGIISALEREINAITGHTIRGVIQTDAAINPGNSGGPLLDSAGRLIGMNTAIFSPSGAYAGIGFAVPVAEINRVVPELIAHGRIIKPGLGVSLVDERVARRLGIEGVIILDIENGSPAEQVGLRPTVQAGGEISLGDIIVGLDSYEIGSYDDLRTALQRYQVGDEVALRFIRDGETMQVRLRLIAI